MRKRVARTLTWDVAPQGLSLGDPGVFIRHASGTRELGGALGQALRRMGDNGRLVFADTQPRHFMQRCVLMIGVPGGVLAIMYRGGATPATEFVRMCDTWRERLGLPRTGYVRWARVKAEAA